MSELDSSFEQHDSHDIKLPPILQHRLMLRQPQRRYCGWSRTSPNRPSRHKLVLTLIACIRVSQKRPQTVGFRAAGYTNNSQVIKPSHHLRRGTYPSNLTSTRRDATLNETASTRAWRHCISQPLPVCNPYKPDCHVANLSG